MWPLTQISRSHRYLTLNIVHKKYEIQTSYNELLIGTYTRPRPAQDCHFKWPWVTLSNSEIFNDTKHRAVSLQQLKRIMIDENISTWTVEPTWQPCPRLERYLPTPMANFSWISFVLDQTFKHALFNVGAPRRPMRSLYSCTFVWLSD